MKKNEIKKIIKPIVKECINEILLQKEGVLASVVSEVARGLQQTTSPIVENKTNAQDEAEARELERKYEQDRQERIKRLNESVGADFFKGTAPAPAATPESSIPGPLSGVAAHDAGVDIRGLMSVAGKRWKKHTK
tara:strand:- start:3556 stop:3960 length:405 start_codon:yes stop_codon:yes gene_type:complete